MAGCVQYFIYKLFLCQEWCLGRRWAGSLLFNLYDSQIPLLLWMAASCRDSLQSIWRWSFRVNLISSSQCCCILTRAMLLNQSSCFFQATSGRYFQVTISSTCCNVRWEYYGDWYIVSSVACFSMYPTTGSFKRIEVFKIRMRAIKMDQINIWSCACFSSLWDILSGDIKIDFSFKIEWIRSMWKLGSKILM